jgi:hypothetical protein
MTARLGFAWQDSRDNAPPSEIPLLPFLELLGRGFLNLDIVLRTLLLHWVIDEGDSRGLYRGRLRMGDDVGLPESQHERQRGGITRAIARLCIGDGD